MQTNTALLEELKTEIAQILSIEPDKLPPQLTVAQTAQVLDVKPDTLSVWRSTGRHNLPFIKTGKSIRYRVVDIVNFIAESRFSQNKKIALKKLKKLFENIFVWMFNSLMGLVLADIFPVLKSLLLSK